MRQYQLKQVIVFSRHGIRTPLPEAVNFLNRVTAKKWPEWGYTAGYLTTRGGTLESYFGAYFIHWLHQKNFYPNLNEIFVYANSLQRTVATAQYFTLGAFPGLDIPINHKYPIERMDEVFNPVIHDTSDSFKNQVVEDLKQYTQSQHFIETWDLHLQPAYDLLAEILDYPHSPFYQQNQYPFANIPTEIELPYLREPILKGTLAISTAIADAFTLQYYSGFKPKDIAWGMIENEQQRKMITEVKNHYINLLFKSPALAAHIAKPLVTFIDHLIKKEKYKLILLFGHDSNIATLMAVLKFKDYQLSAQSEEIPIGGKIIFQRWYNEEDQQCYFKAQYLYQTGEQLHLAIELNLNQPAKIIDLELDGLTPNEHGFYRWEEFETRINRYLVNQFD